MKKLNLNLVGKNKNAWSLLGYFTREAKKTGWTPEEINKTAKEAMRGDYDHLLRVLMEV
jgi:hypothetical protein